jgi:hypothetical protein
MGGDNADFIHAGYGVDFIREIRAGKWFARFVSGRRVEAGTAGTNQTE